MSYFLLGGELFMSEKDSYELDRYRSVLEKYCHQPPIDVLKALMNHILLDDVVPVLEDKFPVVATIMTPRGPEGLGLDDVRTGFYSSPLPDHPAVIIRTLALIMDIALCNERVSLQDRRTILADYYECVLTRMGWKTPVQGNK